MAGWLAEFGPDVQVLEPPELRAAVIGRLRAAVAGNGLAASDEMTHRGGAAVVPGSRTEIAELAEIAEPAVAAESAEPTPTTGAIR
jgi:proteasome accessory factor B